jgi:hypothetical protein
MIIADYMYNDPEPQPGEPGYSPTPIYGPGLGDK